MASALTLALIPCLLAFTVLIQYEVLRWTGSNLIRLRIKPRQRILVVIAACPTAHLLEVLLYATVFAMLFHFPAFGSIAGEFAATFVDFFHFSLTNYTTLGIGEIFPLGPLRLVVGIESLNGLLLIKWSASFCYLNVQDDGHPKTSGQT